MWTISFVGGIIQNRCSNLKNEPHYVSSYLVTFDKHEGLKYTFDKFKGGGNNGIYFKFFQGFMFSHNIISRVYVHCLTI